MFYQTESRPQTWRALAIFKDGSECLIYLGRSTTQVRGGYRTAFLEVLEEDERAQVESISLQCWDGAPDRGQWVAKTTLAIPEREKAVVLVGAARAKTLSLRQPLGSVADDDDEEERRDRVLPFKSSEERPLTRKAVNS